MHWIKLAYCVWFAGWLVASFGALCALSLRRDVNAGLVALLALFGWPLLLCLAPWGLRGSTVDREHWRSDLAWAFMCVGGCALILSLCGFALTPWMSANELSVLRYAAGGGMAFIVAGPLIGRR